MVGAQHTRAGASGVHAADREGQEKAEISLGNEVQTTARRAHSKHSPNSSGKDRRVRVSGETFYRRRITAPPPEHVPANATGPRQLVSYYDQNETIAILPPVSGGDRCRRNTDSAAGGK